MKDRRRRLDVRVTLWLLRRARDRSLREYVRAERRRVILHGQGRSASAMEASRLSNAARERAAKASETLAEAKAGPVKCPGCGWDSHGTLKVRDWWRHEYPPGPRPGGGAAFEVVSDDDELGGMVECPECEEQFDAERMVPR